VDALDELVVEAGCEFLYRAKQKKHNYIIHVYLYMAGIVVLYHFLFSSFEQMNYVFKYGEEKEIQDSDSCHIILTIQTSRNF
jgi:hypothetical protein